MNESKKKKRWTIFGRGFSLRILLIKLFVLYFPRTLLVDFLFYEDKPKKADAIILISGDNVRIKRLLNYIMQGMRTKYY